MLLGNATSRFIYNVLAYYQSKIQATPIPAVPANLTREIHVSNRGRRFVKSSK